MNSSVVNKGSGKADSVLYRTTASVARSEGGSQDQA